MPLHQLSKLGLGTAQWGMRYGSFNRSGQPERIAIASMLRIASMHHIRLIDTAFLYGNAEEILGECLQDDVAFDIVCKTPFFEPSLAPGESVDVLRRSFELSLQRLNRKSLYGLLFHRASDLLSVSGEKLFEALEELRADGKVRKIGVSVYNKDEIESITSRFSVDLIQIPINVLDQRLLKSGVLGRLKQKGIEIHARSAFLQGLLLQSPEKLPAFFKPAQDLLAAFHETARKNQMSPLRAALEFLMQLSEIDKVIVGVETEDQLREILVSFKDNVLPVNFSKFACCNESILDPNCWPKMEGV